VTRVCITADDFGLRPENDEVIVDLARAGRLDAVAVMVHEDASLDTVTRLDGHAAIGLHLVLVGERPLRPDALRPLLDHEGRLPRAWSWLFGAIARQPSLAEALRLEVGAQLDRFASLGLPLGFVNAHQHAHLFPLVWRIVRGELAARSLEPAIRVARGWHPKDLAIVGAQRLAFAIAGMPTCSTPLVAHGLAWSGHASRERVGATLAAISARPPPGGLAEIVLHPGAKAQGAAARHAQWRYRWADEADLLAMGTLDRLCAEHGLVRAAPR